MWRANDNFTRPRNRLRMNANLVATISLLDKNSLVFYYNFVFTIFIKQKFAVYIKSLRKYHNIFITNFNLRPRRFFKSEKNTANYYCYNQNSNIEFIKNFRFFIKLKYRVFCNCCYIFQSLVLQL